jgi:hydroxysqualene dehydroxylase
MIARAFVIGAGLAGLSAAVRLAEKGVRVTLCEAAGQAGGRCRSYFDATMGGTIDNGNHLVLSGNRAVFAYARTLHSEDALTGPRRAEFHFADLASGERWTILPNEGRLPWWVLSPRRRVPGTGPGDYAKLAGLLTAGRSQRIADVMTCQGTLWERLLRPFLLAALNTEPEIASARLAGEVVRETLLKGGAFYRPRIATPTLAAAFIDPALRFLKTRGTDIRMGQRLRALTFDTRHVAALEFPDQTVPLAADDGVVLAVPPWVAQELIPGLTAPNEFRAIVNAHFKIAAPEGAAPMLGVVGGTAEWIFAFEDRISVTVSGADAIVDRDRVELAQTLWRDVARVHNLPGAPPLWQIVKEKRATFAATPEQNARRPKTATSWRNLFLAGDWIDTGLPATIESAVRSGETAARLALSRRAL